MGWDPATLSRRLKVLTVVTWTCGDLNTPGKLAFRNSWSLSSSASSWWVSFQEMVWNLMLSPRVWAQAAKYWGIIALTLRPLNPTELSLTIRIEEFYFFL